MSDRRDFLKGLTGGVVTALPLGSVCFARPVGSGSPAVAAKNGTLGHHAIALDAVGRLNPWFSTNVGQAYDHIIGLCWHWWKNCPMESNGVPGYMIKATFHPGHARYHLAADSHGLALCSWRLYYTYTGDSAVLNVMKYIADFTLNYGLTPSDYNWPYLMFETNCTEKPTIGPGFYNGEMYVGPDYLLPHSSANFANELVDLYKITGNSKYLNAAVNAANTLAAKVRAGNATTSPWPLCVNAKTGVQENGRTNGLTAHCVPAMELFTKLINMGQGHTAAYGSARTTCVNWLRTYPMDPKNGINRFGFYFEDDVGLYNNRDSFVETIPDSLARWTMENPALWGASWLKDARTLLDWTYINCGNNANWDGRSWASMGLMPITEATWEGSFPGNSHTSHHYSTELMYCEKANDWKRKDEAVRGLNWATYFVNNDGANTYPVTQHTVTNNWITDGYGDYVQHYLRAMAASPDLAYDGKSHLLRSSSAVKAVTYDTNSISYATYDKGSREVLRTTFVPTSVTAGSVALSKLSSIADLDRQQGYTFEAPGDASGVVRIRHDNSGSIVMSGTGGRGTGA